jgi:transposase
MPKGKELTDIEKGKIQALHGENISIRGIARRIGRSHKVVLNYLKNPNGYGSKKHKSGRKPKLTRRQKNQIIQCASNSTKSTEEIKKELDLDVHRETVRRVIKHSPHIIRSKMLKAPSLKPEHIQQRLNFARNNMDTVWRHVSCSKVMLLKMPSFCNFVYIQIYV